MTDYEDLAESHPEALADDPEVITEADIFDPEFCLVDCFNCGATEYAADMIPCQGSLWCQYCNRRAIDEEIH